MSRSPVKIRHTPAIIVGSGIAGLSTALGLKDCTVLTRKRLGSGSSGYAQGGIAAALAATDSAADHAADTLAVSAEIADPDVVQAITAAAAGRIEWLTTLGAHFDAGDDGHLSLGREAGHRTHRVVHANGDATGAEVMRALTAAVKARADIDVLEDCALVDLIRCDHRIAGVLAESAQGERIAILAPAVVLATGGIGGLYQRTTNPTEVRGDGLAAAARAGVQLADLEFVQFHPTALNVETNPVPLLTEALRGEGATLIDEHGERFMRHVHPDAELAPRDVVARAIWQQRIKGHDAFLDAREAVGNRFPQRFPSVWQVAQAAGFDPRCEALPVSPAEHYFMGGVAVDIHGQTSLPGLWAVGEVANTGLHGANRLASNSLLEGMVLGAAAARSIADTAPSSSTNKLEVTSVATLPVHAGHNNIHDAVRQLMWNRVGLVRDADGLTAALTELKQLQKTTTNLADHSLLLATRLITEAALQRTESRGAHYRTDYPDTHPAQQQRQYLTPPAASRITLDLDAAATQTTTAAQVA